MPLVDGPKQLKQSGRSSKNTLAYMGVAPESPSNFKTFDKDPTPQDYKNWEVGDEWENRITRDVWKLVAKNRTGFNTAEGIWVKSVGGAGNVTNLTDDAGTVVIPDATGAIKISGGDNINTTSAANEIKVNLNNSIVQPNTNASGSEGLYTLGTTDFISNYGTDNTFLGGAGNRTLTTATAVGNTAIGKGALASITEGTYNVALGAGALDSNTTGSKNIAIGFEALGLNTTGVDNIAIGDNALTICDSGYNNVAVGLNALDSLNTGYNNIAIGQNALASATSAHNSVAIGSNALQLFTVAASGGQNIAIGNGVLRGITTSENNIGMGSGTLDALLSAGGNVEGGQNTVLGFNAASALTRANYNIGLGYETFRNTQSGGATGIFSGNIGIGNAAGYFYADDEGSNILIGSHGEVGDDNTIRIGKVPGSPKPASLPDIWQGRCFVAGIRGVTTGVADAIPVVIDSNGQLGTVSSSIRFKENVEDMGIDSENIYNLRPVTFNYKKDSSKKKQYGLIAEEVAEVFPQLAVKDHEGAIETVKYHELPILLLNEIIKLRARVEELEKKLS